MSLLLDILIVVVIVLGGISGYKAGVLRSLVKFFSLIAIFVLAMLIKEFVLDFLISILPFINFGGKFDGLLSMNIFTYNAIAFLIAFIVLYSIIHLVLILTGFIETVLKVTVIWIIPSKILGAIFGVLTSFVYIVVAIYILGQMPYTNLIVYESNVAPVIMEKLPLFKDIVGPTSNAMDDIAEYIKKNELNTNEIDTIILLKSLSSGVVNRDTVDMLIVEEKVKHNNLIFG